MDGRRLEDILQFGQIQLSDQGWESYANIRTLAWVKSLTITLFKEGLDDSADIVQSVIPVQKNGEALTYNHEPFFLVLLGDGLNRLARIGISAPSEGACISGDHWYFVACWDPEKMAFIKKILAAGRTEAEECVLNLGKSWGEVEF